jgi:6-methylsalicylate decarboxylase
MRRIDTHHHFLPPAFTKAMIAAGITNAGGREAPEWSATESLAFMDRNGIETAILSISTPGVHFGDHTAARKLARTLNENGAEYARDYPGRFGFFATLPLPDVDSAIAEAEYAIGELGADGVILLANTNGVYLGDPAFDRLFDVLNAHKAVIFVHPASVPAPPVPDVVAFAADFLLDTTRAAMKMVVSGTLDRCPDVKIILSHGGGFVPYAAYRIAPLISSTRSVSEGITALKRFYYDLALSSTNSALPCLLAFADPDKITFGSDYPYAPEPVGVDMIKMLEEYDLTATQRLVVDRGNAELLFPRFSLPPK